MNDAQFSLNGETRPWREMTVAEAVGEAGADPGGGVAVARNAEVVPRAEWDRIQVQPGDRIEVVHIVRGG